MKEVTYVEALMEAFTEEMRRDDKVFHLCGNHGPLAALIPEFGEERVRACPISEEAYVGAGIGAAGSGFRPIISPGMTPSQPLPATWHSRASPRRNH